MILVAGGAGYIASHTIIELSKAELDIPYKLIDRRKGDIAKNIMLIQV